MTKSPYLLVMLLVFVSISAYGVGQETDEEVDAKVEQPKTEQIVVPSEGVTKFSVTGRSTRFRLSISTPAGGTIEDPVITGKAKHLRTAEVVQVAADGKPLIGVLRKEFVFRGTAAGDVKIEIKKTVPTSPMPVIEVFHVTIK